MFRFFLLILIETVLCLGGTLPVFAVEKDMLGKVFFVTNRHWTGSSFDEGRGKDTGHSYGSACLAIPASNVRPDMRYWPDKLTSLGWAFSDKASNKYVLKSCSRESADQFYSEISSVLNKSKTDEITVVVHGYCNSFQDSVVSAATMESYLKSVVIDYSWPAVKTSIPSPLKYNIAQNNVAWSQNAFSDFVKSLKAKYPEAKINIFCHSMGSRLVMGALHDLYPDGAPPSALNDVIFSSPDFDAATFSNVAGRSFSASRSVTVYINPKDKAMAFSKALSGYSRAGAPGGLMKFLRASSNVQVYDFCEYGGGITGHSIPYEVVSSIHKYGRLGGRWTTNIPAVQIVRVGTAN